MKRYTISTLGCKVNQCESSALGGLLEGAGYRRSSQGAHPDLVIINTCTVTGKAAMQSRQAIRQAVRKHPDARIVVTGCYAQTAPKEIQNIEGVHDIVGHADKLGIVQMLETTQQPSKAPTLIHQNIQQARCFAPMPSVAPDARTRAFLKIQDGCNAHCTYCIVPHARGRSRSMPLDDALQHLANLSQAGFKEVVLTGIHLGAYGKDLTPRTSLYDLLGMVRKKNPGVRLRISSIEPTEADAGIIELMSDAESRLCPHFHIPLQSGDNNILKRMGRPYTREQFADTIGSIRRQLPHAAIGVDVLVGFPGEDDAAFEQTAALIQSLDITYLHVFPFSPRKGTPAADFDHQVPERIIKNRCRHLRELGEQKKQDFYHSNKGRRVNVLIEKVDAQQNLSKGLSENYIPIFIHKTDVEENTIVPVRIQSVQPDLTVIGTPVV